MDLKLKHVFAVLGVIGVEADEFFLDLYEKPDPVGAVHGLVERSRVQQELEDLKNRIAAVGPPWRLSGVYSKDGHG